MGEHFCVRELVFERFGCLKIAQKLVGDVGCVVWDAAIVLSKFLATEFCQSHLPLIGKRAIELGAGTGAVGLTASLLGAHVMITDLPELLPLLEQNVELNRKNCPLGSIEAASLKWGEDSSTYNKNVDYIFCADVIYYEESLEPLVKTLNELSSPSTTVLLSYEERTTGNKPYLQRRFFEMMQDTFDVCEIPIAHHDVEYRSDDIHIVQMKKM